jgi:hypothetical protein
LQLRQPVHPPQGNGQLRTPLFYAAFAQESNYIPGDLTSIKTHHHSQNRRHSERSEQSPFFLTRSPGPQPPVEDAQVVSINS